MSDLREQLARQIREALGEANDPDLPVVIIVGEVVKRIAALEKDKALLEHELRDIWDYEDEHIEDVLKEQGG